MPSPNHGDRRGRTVDALVLHYTGMATGEAALARLCDPAAEVSCHYLIWEDGRIDQLVAEADRAWHAGRSSWRGERDVNAVSLGIELVNAGHEGGCPPYPARQIDALIALGHDINRRHAIAPARVLAHSDVAPDRKIDPGEWFPWERLAVEGIGVHIETVPITEGQSLSYGDAGRSVAALQSKLAKIGFDPPKTGSYDIDTALIVQAFQRRHRPAIVDGIADASTRLTLSALLEVS